MRDIPLLAEEGRLRHQENAAKPQKRRRRARSASAIARSRNSGHSAGLRRRAELTTPPLRGGECTAPKTLSKKLKVAALLHKGGTQKAQKFCAFCVLFVPFVYLPDFLGRALFTGSRRASWFLCRSAASRCKAGRGGASVRRRRIQRIAKREKSHMAILLAGSVPRPTCF